MDTPEELLHISALAANGQLDLFLAEHGVPEFEDAPALPAPRKFGSRPAFDRSSFDIAAYTAELERHFKK